MCKTKRYVVLQKPCPVTLSQTGDPWNFNCASGVPWFDWYLESLVANREPENRKGGRLQKISGRFWSFLVSLPYGSYVYYLSVQAAQTKEDAERTITEWHNANATYGVYDGSIRFIGMTDVHGFDADSVSLCDGVDGMFRLGSSE